MITVRQRRTAALLSALGLTGAALLSATVSAGAAAGAPTGAAGTGPNDMIETSTVSAACGAARVAAVDPASPEVGDLAADLGLSIAEAAVRIGWQTRAETLDARLRAGDGVRYGGLWIDPDTARVIVGVTAPSYSADVRRLADSCGLAGAVDVIAVANPASALDAAGTWLGARLVAVNAPSTSGFWSAVDYSANRAILGVPDRPLTSPESELISEVRSHLADVVLVAASEGAAVPAACSGGNYCDPPLRGGIRMSSSNGSGCSLGFTARSRSDQKWYAMTAGHCGGGTWSTRFTDSSSHVIGPRHRGVFDERGDAQIVRVNNPAGWSPRGWVLVEASGDTSYDDSYDIVATGSSSIGMRICKTGYTGSTDCGRVTRLGVTVDYGSVVVEGLGEANFCVIPGDSGGPNYASHRAYGLTSGYVPDADPCRSFYQGIRGAQNLLNVDVETE